MGNPLKKEQTVNGSSVASSHTITYLYQSVKPNAATMIGNYRYAYGKDVRPDDVAHGYGYTLPVPLTEDDIFFYHTDHLGSTSGIQRS